MNECSDWLDETRVVFPQIKRKKIKSDYKAMSHKKLGYVSAKVEKRLDFDATALLLGEDTRVNQKKIRPKEFKIYINVGLQKIKNIALRKQIVQYILIHELIHIENEDLLTLSKEYNRRKKKKIHTHDFENDVFKRFNELRASKGIMQIQKSEHLEIAMQRILESINWKGKGG